MTYNIKIRVTVKDMQGRKIVDFEESKYITSKELESRMEEENEKENC